MTNKMNKTSRFDMHTFTKELYLLFIYLFIFALLHSLLLGGIQSDLLTGLVLDVSLTLLRWLCLKNSYCNTLM